MLTRMWYAFLIWLSFSAVASVPSVNRLSGSSRTSKSSFLWRINSSPPCFLFGTIHVPYTRVWDSVPRNALMAFAHAHQLYVEVDVTDHRTLSSLSHCQLLPRGHHISQLLPSRLYLRLKMHLEYVRSAMPGWITKEQRDKGVDAEYLFSTLTANWERKKPVWVLMMLNSLKKSDVALMGEPVLDAHLIQLARQQGKRIHALERVEEQCGPMNQLELSKVTFLLNQTLNMLDNIRLGGLTKDNLIEDYRRGSLNISALSQDAFQIQTALQESSVSSEKSSMATEINDFVELNMNIRRNKQMAARIIDLLVNRPDSYFFAVGTRHLLGDDSIQHFIESAGFTVDHILPGDLLDFKSYANSKHRVQGTFDDLSEDEKTRALLQFLQYRQQQMEKDSSDSLVVEGAGATDDSEADSAADEKAAEESLKVYYGISGSEKPPCASWWIFPMAAMMLSRMSV